MGIAGRSSHGPGPHRNVTHALCHVATQIRSGDVSLPAAPAASASASIIEHGDPVAQSAEGA